MREMHEQADRENVAAPAMNLREEHLLLASREEMKVEMDARDDADEAGEEDDNVEIKILFMMKTVCKLPVSTYCISGHKPLK